MAVIRAFKGWRPEAGKAVQVASRPYDVLNSQEARQEAEGNPISFLHIIKPEIDLPEDIDLYDDRVYEQARLNLDRFVQEGVLREDPAPCLYAYRQIMGEHHQVGLVCCSSIEDYFDDVIKKHEFTRPVKENDRIRHMKTIRAHPGPVFITYPEVEAIDQIIGQVIQSQEAENDFTASDGVRHTLWVIRDEEVIRTLVRLFDQQVPATYIADGHHRAASSAKVGKELAKANPDHSGDEEYNYFLSVLFPANQLQIIDYNRVVRDLNGFQAGQFIEALKDQFTVEPSEGAFKPQQAHQFGLYLAGQWYRLEAKTGSFNPDDPIDVLDVSILSKQVLDPILGIKDQRTDDRIDFVGGIRGLQELEKRVDSGEMALAFSLYPVSIQQLIDVSNSGKVMPPKSTWFEPKLRSGLVVHRF